MEKYLTEIIMAVITFLFGLLMRYLVPSLKNNMNEKQMEMFRVCVKSAVYAAEQIYGSKQGQEKLAYVIKVLDEEGYKVDKDRIEDTTRVLIESFVKELNLEQKKAQEE